jgi:WD40 repeat protein
VLLVFDEKGTLVKSIDDAPIFAWSPDGSQIIYATGKTFSDKDFPSTDRLWLFKLKTQEKEDLGSQTGYTRNIVWASFDSMVYIRANSGVLQIDPKTREEKTMKYWDVNFSPNGKYYYSWGPDLEQIHVFETKSNRDITPSEVNSLITKNYARWVPSGDALIVGDIMFEKKIFDVKTGTVKQILEEGKVLGFDLNKSEFIIHKFKSTLKGPSSSRIEKIQMK